MSSTSCGSPPKRIWRVFCCVPPARVIRREAMSTIRAKRSWQRTCLLGCDVYQIGARIGKKTRSDASRCCQARTLMPL